MSDRIWRGLGTLATVILIPAAAVLLALLATQCGWDKPNPAAYAPVPGNACGNLSFECATNGIPNHQCCLEGEVCGGDPATKYPSLAEDPSCAPGYCCDARQIPDFAKRHPQIDGGVRDQ